GKDRQKTSGAKKSALELKPVACHGAVRDCQTACSEGVDDEGAHISIGRENRPGLLKQLFQRDLAAACPWIVGASDDIETLLEQDLHVHVILFQFQQSTEEQVNIALAQTRLMQHALVAELDAKHDPRALRRQPVEYRGKQSASNGVVAPNSQFACHGIQQEADILHASPELVENSESSIEHGSAE